MTFPMVTEIRLRLEPLTRDTFADVPEHSPQLSPGEPPIARHPTRAI